MVKYRVLIPTKGTVQNESGAFETILDLNYILEIRKENTKSVYIKVIESDNGVNFLYSNVRINKEAFYKNTIEVD